MTNVGTASEPDERQAMASRLWEEHLRAPFPARLRGEDLAGVDMVMLDSDIAGCVDTWLRSRFRLDQHRLSLLRDLRRDLDRVLPLLHDEQERLYYQRLHDVARLVAEANR